jgi:hypothetical protein
VVDPVRIDIFPTLAVKKLKMPDRMILGGTSESSDIRAALGKGAGVLTAHTHSDGIDAFFGNGMTLCPMDRSPVDNAGQDTKL